MHACTVGRHGRTGYARGAAMRSHGRNLRAFAARRVAPSLLACVFFLLLSPALAYADTGLGTYLNNPAGASSVAYEYLTGDDWDDISHEGNSAPAQALLTASTSGSYPNYAAFVDSLYRSQVDVTDWYSRLEGIAFLNACSSARADIRQCLIDHPLNGSGSGSGNELPLGGIEVTVNVCPNTNFTASNGITYYSTGSDASRHYISSYKLKLNLRARKFIEDHSSDYVCLSLVRVNTSRDSYYVVQLYAIDLNNFNKSVSRSNYQVGSDRFSMIYMMTFTNKTDSQKTVDVYQCRTTSFTSENYAPYELAYTQTHLDETKWTYQANAAFSPIFNGTLAYNDTLGSDVPVVYPPSTPVEPDTPSNPVTDALTVNIFTGGTFDDTGIIEAIESLDYDLIAAVNNQNDYLRQLFQYINDDLAQYFYQLDLDLVDAVNWMVQELTNSIGDLDSDVNDGFSDVVDALETLDNDVDYYLYRLEILLNNIYTRLGNILGKMGSGGGGVQTPSRPDPADDSDGFLDWLLDLFQTRLEDLLEQLSLTGLLTKFNLLRQKFPFSIPWDIAAMIALFVHDPVTPVFDVPMPTLAIDGDSYVMLHVDFTSWAALGQASRDGTFVLFAFGLALRTKDLLDGEKVT